MKTKEQALAEIKELQVIDKGTSTAYFQVGNEECAIQRACIEAKYDYESEEYYFGVRYIEYQALPKAERDKVTEFCFESASEAMSFICERAGKINNFFLDL